MNERKKEILSGALFCLLCCAILFCLYQAAREQRVTATARSDSEKAAFASGVTTGLVLAKYLSAETNEERQMWRAVLDGLKSRGAIADAEYLDELMRKAEPKAGN